MRTWFSRLAERIAVRVDPGNGPWRPNPSPWDAWEWTNPERMEIDADLRRMCQDLDAIRVRFAEGR